MFHNFSQQYSKEEVYLCFLSWMFPDVMYQYLTACLLINLYYSELVDLTHFY